VDGDDRLESGVFVVAKNDLFVVGKGWMTENQTRTRLGAFYLFHIKHRETFLINFVQPYEKNGAAKLGLFF
jgi:hypothetical protein